MEPGARRKTHNLLFFLYSSRAALAITYAFQLENFDAHLFRLSGLAITQFVFRTRTVYTYRCDQWPNIVVSCLYYVYSRFHFLLCSFSGLRLVSSPLFFRFSVHGPVETRCFSFYRTFLLVRYCFVSLSQLFWGGFLISRREKPSDRRCDWWSISAAPADLDLFHSQC